MQTTIDAAGRVVIPKSIRESLGLTGGQKIEIRERDGAIEIEPATTAMRLEKRGGHLVAVRVLARRVGRRPVRSHRLEERKAA